MVMIGTDSHKRTHTVVAVDDVGRRLATKTVRTNSDGHLDLVRWSTQFDDVVFALEDCRHLTRRLESDLLIAGYRVVRVPTRLMAAERRGTKEPGKSDPIDAEAVALAALRYPDLPVAELEGPAREVKLLSDHRRDLVVQRTRIASQVRWFVHELDPDRVVPSRGLRRQCVVIELQEALQWCRRGGGSAGPGAAGSVRRAEPADQSARSRASSPGPSARAESAGHSRLRCLVGCGADRRDRRRSPLPQQGCLCPVHRYCTDSGVVRRQRRQGPSQPRRQPSDQLCSPHDRCHPGPWHRPRPAYLAKQQARGKDKTASLRLLRRRLSDAVFAALRTAQTVAGDQPVHLPAAA